MAAAPQLFRCRKCRECVFDSQSIVTVHGEPHISHDGSAFPQSTSCQDVTMETVWYMTADSAPAWILNNIEKAFWSKGKLHCQKCGGRLGSFDFTKSVRCVWGELTVPPIHILKGRIDTVTMTTVTQNNTSRQRNVFTNNYVDAEQNEASSNSKAVLNLDRPVTFDPKKKTQLVDRSPVTFELDPTSTQGNNCHSVSIPSSDKINVKFDSANTHDDNRFDDDLGSEERSPEDCLYSSTSSSGITKSSASKEQSRSEVLLKFVMDKEDMGNGVSESSLRGDNLWHRGGKQPESHDSTLSQTSGRQLESHKTNPQHTDGQQLETDVTEMWTWFDGGEFEGPVTPVDPRLRFDVLQGLSQEWHSYDERCNTEQLESRSTGDDLGDERGHRDTSRRSRQRNGRKRGKTKSVTPLTDNDQDDDESLTYPDEHVCPICLDLLCYPMRTSPCGHIFCESCLRGLARSTPQRTLCPLCRRVISKCHGEDGLAGELKDLYSDLYKKRQTTEKKFRKDSYHRLPQCNRETLRLPRTDRLVPADDRAWIESVQYLLYRVIFILVIVCNVFYRFSAEMRFLPLSTGLLVTGLVFAGLLAVFGTWLLSQAISVLGSVLQILGQTIVQFVGSVFLSSQVESFRSESSQSLLPAGVRLKAMTANFFLVVIVVIICRYVFFRRIMIQLRQNV